MNFADIAPIVADKAFWPSVIAAAAAASLALFKLIFGEGRAVRRELWVQIDAQRVKIEQLEKRLEEAFNTNYQIREKLMLEISRCDHLEIEVDRLKKQMESRPPPKR